jgi:threonine aldolase
LLVKPIVSFIFMIDYRSDTFTLPTPGMRNAMANAAMGDDVFGEDPTVNKLEAFSAELFGMEAALFCPSGTMTNQIAIKCHTQPGEEVICDYLSHIYQYEAGGIAFNSGCSVKLLEGNRGRVTASQIEAAINPEDIHKSHSTLVSLENTSNRGGGSCYNFAEIEAIRTVCEQKKIAFHLDGARLFNALIAQKETTQQYGRVFHSISICLSKGLGAPVGSLLLGNKDFIYAARRYRKVLGGGMRQAGVLAAAGIYALENQVDRLEQDHEHIQLLATAVKACNFCKEVLAPQTNILIFEVAPPYTAPAIIQKLLEQGIRAIAISATQIRLVTHLNIDTAMVHKTIHILKML